MVAPFNRVFMKGFFHEIKKFASQKKEGSKKKDQKKTKSK